MYSLVKLLFFLQSVLTVSLERKILSLYLVNLPFIGNVGDSKALAEVVRSWARPVRLSSTKEILLVRIIN